MSEEKKDLQIEDLDDELLELIAGGVCTDEEATESMRLKMMGQSCPLLEG